MTRTRIKICGITRPEDAAAAAEAGADAIGLVFWPGSVRVVDVKSAQAIRTVVPPSVAVIGVFVEPNLAIVQETADAVGLNAVQLCGMLNGDGWQELRKSLGLLRAISVIDDATIPDSMKLDGIRDYLVDNGSAGRHGGTGETFDWRLAEKLRSWGRIWLAGGLNPRNVGEAIRTVRPHAVDVSTGVEISPGIKSADLMRAFVDAVHRADHAFASGSRDAS